MSSGSMELFASATSLDEARILATWSWLLRKPFRLRGVSIFGDIFLEDADGSIVMLDLVAAELKEIAVCAEEFEWGLGDPGKRDEWLMAGLAHAAHQRGLRPNSEECLAFETPPTLGGALTPENLVAWDLYAYHDGLAKLLPQIMGLTAGTEVRIKRT